MSRLVNAPAKVLSFAPGYDGQPWPHIFEARGGRFVADLESPAAEHFIVGGKWWEQPMIGGEPPQAHFYRLPVHGGGMVELVREDDKSWWLYKVYD